MTCLCCITYVNQIVSVLTCLICITYVNQIVSVLACLCCITYVNQIVSALKTVLSRFHVFRATSLSKDAVLDRILLFWFQHWVGFLVWQAHYKNCITISCKMIKDRTMCVESCFDIKNSLNIYLYILVIKCN